MRNITRRTVTIVTTETWTIVWSSMDSLHPVSRIVHITQETEEELDETLHSGLIATNPNPSQPAAQPTTPSDMPTDSEWQQA